MLFLLIWNRLNITCKNQLCSQSNMIEMVCFLRWYCNRKYKYRHRRTLLQIFHWFVHLGTFETTIFRLGKWKVNSNVNDAGCSTGVIVGMYRPSSQCFKRTIYFLHYFFSSSLWNRNILFPNIFLKKKRKSADQRKTFISVYTPLFGLYHLNHIRSGT
jgi:hypothetical protein